MKTLFIIFLFAVSAAVAETALIKSKEDMTLHAPDAFKISSVGKVAEFKGVIERLYAGSGDLQMIDLYQFKSDAVKVSKELCMSYVEKIFGLSKSKLFSLKTMTMEKSDKGQICEVFISDANKVKEDPYLRYLTIGFVNAKATVLVYHPTSITDAKISEIRKFWENLR